MMYFLSDSLLDNASNAMINHIYSIQNGHSAKKERKREESKKKQHEKSKTNFLFVHLINFECLTWCKLSKMDFDVRVWPQCCLVRKFDHHHFFFVVVPTGLRFYQLVWQMPINITNYKFASKFLATTIQPNQKETEKKNCTNCSTEIFVWINIRDIAHR